MLTIWETGHKAQPETEGIETQTQTYLHPSYAGSHKAQPETEGIETTWP